MMTVYSQAIDKLVRHGCTIKIVDSILSIRWGHLIHAFMYVHKFNSTVNFKLNIYFFFKKELNLTLLGGEEIKLIGLLYHYNLFYINGYKLTYEVYRRF